MSPAAEKTTKQSTDTQKTGMPISAPYFPPALVQKQDKDEREASDPYGWIGTIAGLGADTPSAPTVGAVDWEHNPLNPETMAIPQSPMVESPSAPPAPYVNPFEERSRRPLLGRIQRLSAYGIEDIKKAADDIGRLLYSEVTELSYVAIRTAYDAAVNKSFAYLSKMHFNREKKRAVQELYTMCLADRTAFDSFRMDQVIPGSTWAEALNESVGTYVLPAAAQKPAVMSTSEFAMKMMQLNLTSVEMDNINVEKIANVLTMYHNVMDKYTEGGGTSRVLAVNALGRIRRLCQSMTSGSAVYTPNEQKGLAVLSALADQCSAAIGSMGIASDRPVIEGYETGSRVMPRSTIRAGRRGETIGEGEEFSGYELMSTDEYEAARSANVANAKDVSKGTDRDLGGVIGRQAGNIDKIGYLITSNAYVINDFLRRIGENIRASYPPGQRKSKFQELLHMIVRGDITASNFHDKDFDSAITKSIQALRKDYPTRTMGHGKKRRIVSYDYGDQWTNDAFNTIRAMFMAYYNRTLSRQGDKEATVLQRDMRFVRVVNNGYLNNVFGTKIPDESDRTDSYDRTEALRVLNGLAGKEFMSHGFMSVGYQLDVAFVNRSTVLTVLCDAGTRVYTTYNSKEAELLFMPGTKFMVMGAFARGENGMTFNISNSRKKMDFRGMEVVIKIINDGQNYESDLDTWLSSTGVSLNG